MKWPGRKQLRTQGTWLVQSQSQSKSQRKRNNKRRRIPKVLIDLVKKHLAARVKQVRIPKGAVNLTEHKVEVSPKLEAGVWLHVGAASTASWTQPDVPPCQLCASRH